MSTPWVVTPGMKTVTGAFNRAFPNRDKTSDGTIGDLAHQNESASSHNPDITGRAEWKDGDNKNEVRADDIDSDLRDQSGYGITMEMVIQYLVTMGRAGKLAKYIRYMIYNERIWSASDNWVTRKYTGASQHKEHAHFTGAFTQFADENTANVYNLEELMALSAADKTWITAQIKAGVIAALKTDGVVQAPDNAASKATNPTWATTSALTDVSTHVRIMESKLDAIMTATKATPPKATGTA